MKVVEEGTQAVVTIAGSEDRNFNKVWARFWFVEADTVVEDAFAGKQYKAPTAEIEGDAGLVGDEAAVRAYLGGFLG